MRFRVASNHLIRWALSCLLFYSGAAAAGRIARRLVAGGRANILCYHGFRPDFPYLELFAPPDIFGRQLHYLARTHTVTTLSELVARLRRGEPFVRDTVVVTIDDGYRDNHEVLLPLVRKLRVPVTIFVTTGCLDTQRPTFVAAAMLCVDQTTRPELDFSGLGLGQLRAETPGEKEHVIRQLNVLFKQLKLPERVRLLETVVEVTGVGPQVLDGLMLTWEQARELSSAGVEFGAHTVTHPVLRNLTDDEAAYEITESVRRVRQELGLEQIPFAYPYGGRQEVDERIIALCATLGPSAAVSLVNRRPSATELHWLGRDLMTLDRTTTPWGSFSRALFACEVEGWMDIVRRVTGKTGRPRHDRRRVV
jgi:peptidoglycan/xylan/chitin deacetylase (PgdA/CDA1 family)